MMKMCCVSELSIVPSTLVVLDALDVMSDTAPTSGVFTAMAAPASSSGAATHLARGIGKLRAKEFKAGMGAILIVMGVIALIPSVLSVAQWTTLPPERRDPKNYGIYVVSAIFTTLAVLSIVAGIIVLAVPKLKPTA